MFRLPTFLERIPLAPPFAAIYTRLGFRKRKTTLSSLQKQQTDEYISRAASLIALRGSFIRLPVEKNDGKTIWCADELSLESAKLAAFLGDCREVVLLGATAGNTIMEAIREKTNQDDFTAAVVYDAAASEMTDAALDWIADYINRQLRRESKYLETRRFSAGYADFALENQKIFYEKLQLHKLDVQITESFLLNPEKSVTAISGIFLGS